jgi:hypothetical protein
MKSFAMTMQRNSENQYTSSGSIRVNIHSDMWVSLCIIENSKIQNGAIGSTSSLARKLLTYPTDADWFSLPLYLVAYLCLCCLICDTKQG